MTTWCHSVRSWRLPSRSFQLSDVATRKLTTSPPLLSERDSGIRAQIADQDHLVHARHVTLSSS